MFVASGTHVRVLNVFCPKTLFVHSCARAAVYTVVLATAPGRRRIFFRSTAKIARTLLPAVGNRTKSNLRLFRDVHYIHEYVCTHCRRTTRADGLKWIPGALFSYGGPRALRFYLLLLFPALPSLPPTTNTTTTTTLPVHLDRFPSPSLSASLLRDTSAASPLHVIIFMSFPRRRNPLIPRNHWPFFQVCGVKRVYAKIKK